MAFNVRDKKLLIITIINIKNTVVCGRCSKLKNGPIIVNINPSVEEIKNLGKRSMLSQKSDIKLFLLHICHVFRM